MGFFESLLAYFKKKPAEFTGALLDDRAPEAKAKDYDFDELVAKAAGVEWKTRAWEEFRRFPMQNQDGSSSCVWQTIRKLYRVLMKVNRGLDLDFSATYGYRQRRNHPNPGTIAFDAFEQAQKGITLNALLPSDNLSEYEMNTAKIEEYHRKVAEDFKIPYYVQIKNGDIFEKVASTIQTTKKAVMVWFYFTSEEWSRETPVVIDKYLTSPFLARALVHSVAAVDFGVYNGKRGLFIEDSAHFGGKYERFITEDFFRQRNIYAAYLVNFVFEPGGDVAPDERPTYTHGDVVSLQDCLKFEGLFPKNQQSTGVYGNITTKAVKDFQVKYGLEPVGTVGPKTKKKLEELYP